MTSTSYEYADYVAADNRADLHVDVDGEWQPEFERMPDAQAPAGGISSNVVDLATWARIVLGSGALDDDEIVDADAFARVVTPAAALRTPMPPSWHSGGYGLGIIVGTDAHGNARWNHSGAFSNGAATTAVFLPGLDVGIVVLTNAQPVGASEAIADAFMDRLESGSVTRNWNKIWSERLASVYGEPEDIGDPPASPAPPSDDAAYLGTYSNEYLGDFEVVESSSGGLAIVQGPARVTYDLTPFDGDVFTYAHAPELPDYLSTVTFTMGPDGRATAIDVSVYDELGWGLLQRA
jgi:CubicO group peptidase (beta-lactamase class C family)